VKSSGFGTLKSRRPCGFSLPAFVAAPAASIATAVNFARKFLRNVPGKVPAHSGHLQFLKQRRLRALLFTVVWQEPGFAWTFRQERSHETDFALYRKDWKCSGCASISMIYMIDMIRLAVRPCGQSPRFTTE